MTPEQIDETIIGLLQGQIVTASELPEDMIASVFMPVGLGGLADIDATKVGNIFEHMNKAGPLAVNGYPIFMSCQVAHKDDWEEIAVRTANVAAATAEAMEASKQPKQEDTDDNH